MKVTIVKYLNPKGKVVEMRKDNFKGSYMPENIIEEYEVEIKGEDFNETGWLEELKRKYATGNYILLWKANYKLENPIDEDYIWTICDIGIDRDYWDYKLIHNKHKDILKAYLKNPSFEIECTNYISKDADIETIWYLEKDFIEDYNEEFWYRLKVEDLAWYEENDNFRIAVKQIKSLNNYAEFIEDDRLDIMCKIIDTKGVSSYTTNGYHTPLQFLNCYRPATESEVLSLVYKPQQKVSKEINLTESDRLKDLFLNDKAECLVENEQEFKLVYDFLDETCDKSLNRYLEADGRFEYSTYNDEFPIILSTLRKWGNIFEWNKLKNRNKNKPLIKFNGETFWEVFE